MLPVTRHTKLFRNYFLILERYYFVVLQDRCEDRSLLDVNLRSIIIIINNEFRVAPIAVSGLGDKIVLLYG